MPNPSHLRIEAAHKKISEVFSKDYAFSIPAYQRPYSWETMQVEELLDDLEEARKLQPESGGFYFLGSIVLIKTSGNPKAQIVDGQQRLTTLTILLCVIRDLTKDQEKRYKRGQYIKQQSDDDQNIPEALRLQLRKKDQDFFKEKIQDARATTESLPTTSDCLIGSQARIVENALTIREKLEAMGREERNNLMKFLLQNCYLVVVAVPTELEARRIFTVLNTRGMDLSATDILKAKLLENADDTLSDALSERWENMETHLGRDEFSDLFTHIRMIYEREKPRTALERGFPEQVSSFGKNPTEFMSKILEPYSNAFTLSQNDTQLRNKFGDETADLIQSLARLDNKDWVPPLLLCLHQSNENASNDVPQIVFKLERLAYYLFMVRANVNVRMARYANVLNFLKPHSRRPRTTSASENTTGLEITQNEAFNLFNALVDDNIYHATRVVKPILLRLEQASHDSSAHYSHKQISIEHVCPQKIDPGSQWKTWFPSSECHDKWVHSLSNLVLLNIRKNSAAGNYEFKKKKDKYFARDNTCPFTITNDIKDYESWKPQDLKKRRKEILKRMSRAWRLGDEFENWWRENELRD